MSKEVKELHKNYAEKYLGQHLGSIIDHGSLIDRLEDEKSELDTKIKRFESIINDRETISKVGARQYDLMRYQLVYMKDYADVLRQRIDDLKER